MKIAQCLVALGGLLASFVSLAAQISPNASVTPNVVNYGDSVTLVQDGYCAAGVAWTENVVWRPDGSPDGVGNTPGFGSISYTPQAGPGTYWYQYRLVDTNYNYEDQWVSFTVTAGAPTASASVLPDTIVDGQSVTLVRDGQTPAGFGWTENVIWQPDGQAVVLGNAGLGSDTYTPTNGPGTYWYQFRIVDAAQNYVDQWIPFTVNPAAPNTAPTVQLGGYVFYQDAAFKYFNVTSTAQDADGNLVQHYMALNGPNGTLVTDTTPNNGSSSVKLYTLVVPRYGATTLWAVAVDSAGVTTSTAWIFQ